MDWKKGGRVRLSKKAIESDASRDRRRTRLGTLTSGRVTRDSCLGVLWDGTVTPDYWHEKFLEVVDDAKNEA